MTDVVASRLGEINALGSEYALFLKVFAGEVLAAFDEFTVMQGRHRVRSIASGKSAQFPELGKAAAAYHIPGEDIIDNANGYLSTINANEKIISIDNFLTSAVFISQIDELMNHYDVRSEYAHQMGQALANKYDQQLIQLGIIGARTSTTAITGDPLRVGGTVVEAAFMTDPALAVAALAAAAQNFDEKNVPRDQRYAVVRPDAYYNLAQSTLVLSSDYNPPNGSVAEGKVMKVAGINIVMSNHIPSTAVANDTGANNTYGVDGTKTEALCFQYQGLGTVQRLGLTTESEYQIQRQGTLMVAKFALGHGMLRPECCFEIRNAV